MEATLNYRILIIQDNLHHILRMESKNEMNSCLSTKFYFTLELSTDCTVFLTGLGSHCVLLEVLYFDVFVTFVA